MKVPRLSARGRLTAVVLVALAIGMVFGAILSTLRGSASAGVSPRIVPGFRVTGYYWLLELSALLIVGLAVFGLLAAVRGALRPMVDPLAAMTDTVRQLGPQNLATVLAAAQRPMTSCANWPTRWMKCSTGSRPALRASGGSDVHIELAGRHQVRLQRTLAPRTVPGDQLLLERMIVNLVHNGIKYNHPDGVVEVTVTDEPALTVCNTGQPVPAEAVPSLFEPFRRLATERTHQRDGAGLGLPIVRSIAAAHHGWVSATPGESGGLCVRVSLPTSKAD